MHSMNSSTFIKKTLGEIATLLSGQAFQSGLQNYPTGDYWILGSDAVKDGEINQDRFIRYSSANAKPSKYLKQGDVIVASKSSNHKAYIFELEAEDVVANSFFQIIRIEDRNELLPEYLAWYLNHPNVQYQLELLDKGSTVKNLGKKELLNFKVTIPSLLTQKDIVEAAELVSKKVNALNVLINETKAYWGALLWDQVEGGEDDSIE